MLFLSAGEKSYQKTWMNVTLTKRMLYISCGQVQERWRLMLHKVSKNTKLNAIQITVKSSSILGHYLTDLYESWSRLSDYNQALFRLALTFDGS